MIDVWDSIARTLFALAIVLLLMGAAAWVARRVLIRGAGAPSGTPLIQIVANSYLAPKQSITIVAIAGEYFVVGRTAETLVSLGRIEDRGNMATLLAASEPLPLPHGLAVPSLLKADWWQELITSRGQGKNGGPDA